MTQWTRRTIAGLTALLAIATIAFLLGTSTKPVSETGTHPPGTPVPAASPSETTVLDSDHSPAQTPTGRPTMFDTSVTSPPPHQQPPARPGKTGRPRGQTGNNNDIDHTNPLQVALAFTARLYTWDTNLDTRPADAAKRAAPFATPTLAKDLHLNPYGSEGAEWTTLAAHHGYTTVKAHEDNLGPQPKDTPQLTIKIITVDNTPRNDQGWTGQTTTETMIIGLTHNHTTKTWQVSRYQIAS